QQPETLDQEPSSHIADALGRPSASGKAEFSASRSSQWRPRVITSRHGARFARSILASPTEWTRAPLRMRMPGRSGASPASSFEEATPRDGSWWPEWIAWLAERSTAERGPPPGLGTPDNGYPPINDAPGTYIFQR